MNHVQVYLFWCKVQWLLKVSLKLSCCVVLVFLIEAIKGKVQAACHFQSGSTWCAGGIRTTQHWYFVFTPVHFTELI